MGNNMSLRDRDTARAICNYEYQSVESHPIAWLDKIARPNRQKYPPWTDCTRRIEINTGRSGCHLYLCLRPKTKGNCVQCDSRVSPN